MCIGNLASKIFNICSFDVFGMSMSRDLHLEISIEVDFFSACIDVFLPWQWMPMYFQNFCRSTFQRRISIETYFHALLPIIEFWGPTNVYVYIYVCMNSCIKSFFKTNKNLFCHENSMMDFSIFFDSITGRCIFCSTNVLSGCPII